MYAPFPQPSEHCENRGNRSTIIVILKRIRIVKSFSYNFTIILDGCLVNAFGHNNSNLTVYDTKFVYCLLNSWVMSDFNNNAQVSSSLYCSQQWAITWRKCFALLMWFTAKVSYRHIITDALKSTLSYSQVTCDPNKSSIQQLSSSEFRVVHFTQYLSPVLWAFLVTLDQYFVVTSR